MHKNNNKILAVVINSSDRLWYIHIKSHMQNNNFKMLSISPGLYQSKTSSPLNMPSKKKIINSKKSALKNFQEIPKNMKQLDPLVYHNFFDETIKNHSANVIIKKIQTHSNLSQCLDAPCLSPNVSIFKTAIKKKHLHHDQD